ncbi:MAG: hypothetical protein GY936_17100 [Ignavibacteriae bacterium]|nr:hypothetical protein [Ignavibacteriota bacterium]
MTTFKNLLLISNEMNYKYKGAEVLIRLHEEHLLSFIGIWKTAKEVNIKLPITDDSDYQSLDHLLLHVVRSSQGYIMWICEKLNLPELKIDILPKLEEIEITIDNYILHLLEEWKVPLANVDEKRFFDLTYKSNWETEYCIEAMLEHAVMHPIRHEYQLKKILENC